MQKYVCLICGYIHDEAKDGSWESLQDDWLCPLCKATKESFKVEETSDIVKVRKDVFFEAVDMFSDELKSVIFSNLANASEKQHDYQQAEYFSKMSDYYTEKWLIKEGKELKDVEEFLKKDLDSDYEKANIIAGEKPDRGALRALKWNQGVSRILESILKRDIKDVDIHVCDACGFIYIGNDLPDICPVCKVPKVKLLKVEGGL